MARGARYGVNNGSIIEDLVQEIYTKICANDFRLLRTFRSNHANACYGMIKTISRNAAIDHFRKPHPIPPDYSLVEDDPPEDEGLDELNRQIVLEQIDRIDKILKKHCSQRDQGIFWLYYLQEFSAREIAELPNFKPLTIKGVESILYRLKRLICEKWEE